MLQVWAVKSFWTHARWDPVNKMRNCRCGFISSLAWLHWKPPSRFNQHVCLCSEVAYTYIYHRSRQFMSTKPLISTQLVWYKTPLQMTEANDSKLCQSVRNFWISSRQTSATASFSHTFPMPSFRRFVKRCYVTGDGWFLGGVEVGPLDMEIQSWHQWFVVMTGSIDLS